MKKTSEDLQEMVREIATEIKATKSHDAVLAISDVDGVTGFSVTGQPQDLVLLVAKLIIEKPEMVNVFKEALDCYPLVAVMYGREAGYSAQDICDCANCVERRRQAAANPNVN